LSLSAETQEELPAVLVSAVTGRGMDDLLAAIERGLLRSATKVRIFLRPQDGRARAWLHRNGEVLTEEVQDSADSWMTVRLKTDRFGHSGPSFPQSKLKLLTKSSTPFFDRLPQVFLRIEI
jgi:GTP-binding protein HflX